MIQAAAVQGIDFTAAEPRNRWWWIRTGWLLDQLEFKNVEKLYILQHQQTISVLSQKLEADAFKQQWEAANNILQHVWAINFPWSKDAKDDYKKREYERMMEKWKEKFGDPKDPAVQARFAKVATQWKAKSEEAKKNMFAKQKKEKDHLRNAAKRGRSFPRRTRK